MPEVNEQATQQDTVKDIRQLIKPTRTAAEAAAEEETDFDMVDYANMDETFPDELEEEQTPGTGTETQETEPAANEASKVDWQAVAAKKDAELQKLRAEQTKREHEDFERRVAELPEAERAQYVIDYYKERERKQTMAAVRQQQAQTHPLSTILLSPFIESFDVEIDDPNAYSQAMDSYEQEVGSVVSQIVEERVKQEMEKFYATAGKNWGAQKLNDAHPGSIPQPRNPNRSRYEEQQQAMKKPGAAHTIDALASLVRMRQRSGSR